MSNIDAIVAERGKTHGDWASQSYAAAEIRNAIQKWDTKGLPAWQMEALLMIAVKISRILQGDSVCRDHWLDVAGYAKLVSDRIAQAPATTAVMQKCAKCDKERRPDYVGCPEMDDKCPFY